MNPRHALTTLGIGVLSILAVATAGGRSLDWSTGRTHTLATSTTEFLDHIDQPIRLEVFYATNQPGRADVIELARRFAQRNSHITVTIDNPDGTRALELRVASGAVVATAESNPTNPVAIRNPDETDLISILATATGAPDPNVTPHRQPSQPLFPTPLGRTLLWLGPIAALPALLALSGLGIIWQRRRRSQ